MIRMSVTALAIDPRTLQPIVLLNDHAKLQGLPIWIGTSEAKTISLAMQNVKSPRPTAHDLLVTFIKDLKFEIKEIHIDRLNPTTYRAAIKLVPNDKRKTSLEKVLDARPSDAIALAIRTGAPIFVSPKIAIDVREDKNDDDAAAFHEFVEGVKASDFNNASITVTLEEDSQPTDELPPPA